MDNQISLSHYRPAKIITLVLALNIFVSLPMHSSQAYAEQPNGINISPEIINYVSNQLFWFIAALPLTVLGIQHIKQLRNEQLTVAMMNCKNVDQKISDFINTEVKKITPISLDGIVISPHCSEVFPIGSLSKHILMAQYVADEILQALEKNDPVVLNKWRAVIQHEANHIKNNDVFWRAIFELIAPSVIGGTVNYFVNTYEHRSFWHKQYLIVYFGLISYTLSAFTRSVFCKYQEQRADDTIKNQTSLLIGMRTFISDFEALNKKNYTLPQCTYPFIRWYFNLFEEHPLNSVRIKKLNARIAALKKQNQTVHT